MPIKWRLEITRITIPNGDKSRVQDRQFEVDTIREAKERADDISKSLIEREHPSPLGALETGDLEWTMDNEENSVTKMFFPQKRLMDGRGIEIHHLHQYYTRIEPIDISLSEIKDYAET